MSTKTEFQIERIAFFSDAVFAIAITLMVLEIHAPEFAAGTSNLERIVESLHLVPEVIAVLGSFFLIGIYWRRHHQLFGLLKEYDGRLITLNLIFLASIIFLPLSTGFVSKNWRSFGIGNQMFLPFVVYGLNYLVSATTSFLLFRHALDSRKGLFEADDTIDPQKLKLEVMFPIFVFLVVTVVSCFSGFLALPCFALFALEPVFIKRLLGNRNG